MPKYTIRIKNSAIKELEKLQGKDYDKVSQLIFSLADDPRPSGYKKLQEFKIVYITHGMTQLIVIP